MASEPNADNGKFANGAAAVCLTTRVEAVGPLQQAAGKKVMLARKTVAVCVLGSRDGPSTPSAAARGRRGGGSAVSSLKQRDRDPIAGVKRRRATSLRQRKPGGAASVARLSVAGELPLKVLSSKPNGHVVVQPTITGQSKDDISPSSLHGVSVTLSQKPPVGGGGQGLREVAKSTKTVILLGKIRIHFSVLMFTGTNIICVLRFVTFFFLHQNKPPRLEMKTA